MQSLEDILKELGIKKTFLAEMIINEDGTRQPFTKPGSKAVVGELTNTDMNDVVEELDSIANQEF